MLVGMFIHSYFNQSLHRREIGDRMGSRKSLINDCNFTIFSAKGWVTINICACDLFSVGESQVKLNYPFHLAVSCVGFPTMYVSEFG